MASLVCLVIAIVAFLLAAFGVGSKLGIDIVDLGLAFFAAAFIFSSDVVRARVA